LIRKIWSSGAKYPFLTGCLLLAGWAGLSSLYPDWLLPGPLSVLSLLATRILVWKHASRTLLNAVCGFALALGPGFLLGALIYKLPQMKNGLYPYLLAITIIPLEALGAILFLFFGIGNESKIAASGLASLCYLSLGTFTAFQEVPTSILEAAALDGASSLRLTFSVLIPCSMRVIILNIRYACVAAFISASVTELFGARMGLGYFIAYSIRRLDKVGVFAGALAAVAISSCIYGLTALLERKAP